jgi:hypothetical protein
MLGAVFAMISLADLAVATAIAAGARSQSLAPLIEVVILPVIENGAAKALQTALAGIGEADGETVLTLPNMWGGEDQLYRVLSDFSVRAGTLRDGAALISS